MAYELGRERGTPVYAGLHQVDAPAGRIHFLAPKHVRRAGRQAEPTVHALVDKGRWRCVGAGKSGRHLSCRGHGGAPPDGGAAAAPKEARSRDFASPRLRGSLTEGDFVIAREVTWVTVLPRRLPAAPA